MHQFQSEPTRNGVLAYWLGCSITNPGASGLKPQGGFQSQVSLSSFRGRLNEYQEFLGT